MFQYACIITENGILGQPEKCGKKATILAWIFGFDAAANQHDSGTDPETRQVQIPVAYAVSHIGTANAQAHDTGQHSQKINGHSSAPNVCQDGTDNHTNGCEEQHGLYHTEYQKALNNIAF